MYANPRWWCFDLVKPNPEEERTEGVPKPKAKPFCKVAPDYHDDGVDDDDGDDDGDGHDDDDDDDDDDQRRTGRDVRDVRVRPWCRTKDDVGLRLP